MYQMALFREEVKEQLKEVLKENRLLRRIVEERADGDAGNESLEPLMPLRTMEEFDAEERRLKSGAHRRRWVCLLP